MTGLFYPRYILTSTNVLQRNGEIVLQIKEKQHFFLSDYKVKNNSFKYSKYYIFNFVLI